MENLTQIIGVPVITAIVYGAMALYKYIVNGKEGFIRIIPVLAVVLGVILGVIAYYTVKSIMPAENIFTAILVGGVSGLAATGGNQIFKQLTKCKNDDSEENKKDEKQ